MKVRQRWKQNIARFLVACMMLTFVPVSVITSARAAELTVSNEAELKAKYASAQNGDVIRLTANIALTEPLQWDRDISITLDGGGYRISPETSFPVGASEQYYLLNITQTDVHFKNITFDGDRRTGGIYISNNCTQEQTYHFDGVKIQWTSRVAGNGSGLTITSFSDSVPVTSGFTGVNSTKVTINNGSVFDQNILNKEDSSSFGGALYARGNVLINIDDATFSNNVACSGGAISQTYSYITMTSRTVFQNNNAGQRGGVMICNGPLVLDGTKMSGNTSDQFGGAIFVAAHSGNHGQVVMKNGASITGNTANSAGGGAYISDEAEVYLDEASNGQEISIQDNKVPNNQLVDLRAVL